MSPALLALILLSASPRGGMGATDCWMSCQRHVQEASLRSRICQACLTRGGTDAWVLALGDLKPVPQQPLRSALTDENWRVRWAAVRTGAKARKVPEARALAEWVMGIQGTARLPACLTAARAAAEAGRTPVAFFKGAGDKAAAAAARVQAHKEPIREALEVEVYAEDVAIRERALSHLATFLGQPPARVAVNAMEGRPESADAAVAGALRAVAERQESSVGRMLLEVARPGDQERVNRLFALYSQELQALAPDLASGDPMKRRTAVSSLRIYGPLAQREFEQALTDPDARVRQLAARGLAQAEGLTVLEAAGQRLRTGAQLDAQRPWLEALAREKRCQAALLAVAEDARQPAPVRGEALAQLTECDKGGSRERLRRVGPFLRDGLAPLRSGAVRALGAMTSGAELAELLRTALEDPSPEVVTAAIDTAAHKRQTAHAEAIADLLGSAHVPVRQAAAHALERLGRPQQVKALSECLLQDTVPAVRVSAAQALGVIGGPFAVSALSEAAQKDPDTHVQHVAREALKRLGFSR